MRVGSTGKWGVLDTYFLPGIIMGVSERGRWVKGREQEKKKRTDYK